MPLACGGYSKLVEEVGELLQAAGKRLAYWTTDVHPDGGPPLTQRVQEEMADVLAICTLLIDKHGLDKDAIQARTLMKLTLFRKWDSEPDNNATAVDRHTSG